MAPNILGKYIEFLLIPIVHTLQPPISNELFYTMIIKKLSGEKVEKVTTF